MTLINNGIPLPNAHGFPLTTCGNDVDDEASTIKCGAAMTIMKPQYLNEELTVQFEIIYRNIIFQHIHHSFIYDVLGRPEIFFDIVKQI